MNSYPYIDIKNIIDSLNKYGITNPYLQAGILANDFKETGLNAKRESSYSGTSATRLRKIFPTRLGSLTDDEINTLKKDDVKFFDKIYGGMLGNIYPGDGWKFRGGSFNQITGRDQYYDYGKKLGVDFISDPDLIDEPENSADSLALYFATAINNAKRSGRLLDQTGVSDINKIPDLTSGVLVAVLANAGFPKNPGMIVRDGVKNASDVVKDLYEYTKPSVTDYVTTPLRIVTNNLKKKKCEKVYSLREAC